MSSICWSFYGSSDFKYKTQREERKAWKERRTDGKKEIQNRKKMPGITRGIGEKM